MNGFFSLAFVNNLCFSCVILFLGQIFTTIRTVIFVNNKY